MLEYVVQVEVIAHCLHMSPCVKIVNASIDCRDRLPGISISLENPAEKKLSDSTRSYEADAFSIAEVSLMFMSRKDKINVKVSGDYTQEKLRKCAVNITDIIGANYEIDTGSILSSNRNG